MRDFRKRLRAADPAAALPPQPDERAERDLQVLLSEPAAAAAPGPPAPVVVRTRRAPVLVTAVVGLLVVAGAATVLGTVRPWGTTAAAPTASAAPTGGPPFDLGDCLPTEVMPFLCGTYRSTYGGPAVTGDTGGPAEDPLSISFTAQRQGVLVLEVRSERCFAGAVPVRHEGGRLVRAGEALIGQGDGCAEGSGIQLQPGTGAGSWVQAFLDGPMEVAAAPGALVFGSGSTLVTFEYRGPNGVGEQQPARNGTACAFAVDQPFECGDYRTVSGTGALAFLGEHPYRGAVARANGEVVLGLTGDCNGTSASLQADGREVVATPGATTLIGCPPEEQARDSAVSAFFDGVLTYAISEDTITFRSDDASVVLRRNRPRADAAAGC